MWSTGLPSPTGCSQRLLSKIVPQSDSGFSTAIYIDTHPPLLLWGWGSWTHAYLPALLSPTEVGLSGRGGLLEALLCLSNVVHWVVNLSLEGQRLWYWKALDPRLLFLHLPDQKLTEASWSISSRTLIAPPSFLLFVFQMSFLSSL